MKAQFEFGMSEILQSTQGSYIDWEFSRNVTAKKEYKNTSHKPLAQFSNIGNLGIGYVTRLLNRVDRQRMQTKNSNPNMGEATLFRLIFFNPLSWSTKLLKGSFIPAS